MLQVELWAEFQAELESELKPQPQGENFRKRTLDHVQILSL